MQAIWCDHPKATHAVGVRLGQAAQPGTVVALIGELGAGKTLFARGVGQGLGVQSLVTSPTYVMVQEHTQARLPFWHMDWYRLSHLGDLEPLGFDDCLHASGVVLIEWADRFPSALPKDRLVVTIEHRGTARELIVRATGPRHASLEAHLG